MGKESANNSSRHISNTFEVTGDNVIAHIVHTSVKSQDSVLETGITTPLLKSEGNLCSV